MAKYARTNGECTLIIPKNINQAHVIKAIREIDKNGVPKGRKSKKFQLFYYGKYYPPKYIISLANRYANGVELEPLEFSGGQETNNFLKKLGFEVEFQSSRKFLELIHIQRKMCKGRELGHNERCPECKNTIKRMLGKIYGGVEVNYKFKVGTKPEDYEGIPFYSQLKAIFSKLQKFRGYKRFVRVLTLPRCDFFVPNPGFIVEFDETQHFTASRRIALSMYPESFKLGFDRENWIKLCERINAKDNDPPYRDEQRAWYDTLRDFIPVVRGLNPTIRLFSKDFQWCSLNPEVAADEEKFMEILEGRKSEWNIEIRADHHPSLARLIIAGDWNGDLQVTRKLLNSICEKWPKIKKIDCLITCGGFLIFDWPDSLPIIGDNKNPNQQAVNCLIDEAEKQCNLLLQDGLYEKLKEHTDYMTLGVDSYNKKISLTKNYISQPHIELVALIDLRRKSYYWIGKSYPTSKQERGLIRISDLGTHFFDLDFGKVMILGCHDLIIFSNRNWKRTKGWRKQLKINFRDLARRKNPKIVLHHPHTTDSTRTWATAWGVLKIMVPSVKKYASAGRYYNPDGEQRSDLDEVLEKTKSADTLDFIVCNRRDISRRGYQMDKKKE